uniref:CACN subunit beta associated regulatory protein b n=1 Tax=Hippocampus comes TaxID=109280 RepID=A0A3Q3DPQ5_HIPCM
MKQTLSRLRAATTGSRRVLQFLSKLRRHTSLEGAGPYFKRWKFDRSHRAASLDAKGSPKRRPFQRQRAASETTDHTEDDSSLRNGATGSFPQTPSQTSGLQSLSAESLSQPSMGHNTSQQDRRTTLENLEAQPSLYRDIWSLRASLEQYASSDQSSTDRESIRSDAESVSSLGASAGLLQMDSGYASIETPSKGPEEMRIFGIPAPPSLHRPRLHRRDYSIDEKTDALFNEFLRHDPRFDQPDSPFRTRHRSRVHLRKQWQRHKQYSDPGSGAGGRYSPSLERQRFTPLPRGDSASYPLDTRYHSTLSRIASAADEEPAAGSPSSSLTDKLAAAVEERLYGGLRRAELSQGGTESAVAASHTASPDHSPK